LKYFRESEAVDSNNSERERRCTRARARAKARARARASSSTSRGIVCRRAPRYHRRGDSPAIRPIRRPIRRAIQHSPVEQCPVEQSPIETARKREIAPAIPNRSITSIRQYHNSMQHHHLRNRQHELGNEFIPDLQYRDGEGVIVVVCPHHTAASAQSSPADDHLNESIQTRIRPAIPVSTACTTSRFPFFVSVPSPIVPFPAVYQGTGVGANVCV